MKILITGGTSSLCSALKPVLATHSEVITAGRQQCDITLDFSTLDWFQFPHGIDTLIHTVASSRNSTPDEIYTTENINVLGTLKVCQAAVESGIKHLIFISSIFANLDPASPFYNIYTLSKKHAEEIASLYSARHALPLTILRPAQLYDDDCRFRHHQPFLYNIIDKAQQGEDVLLYGTNDAHRNYLHLEDLTAIICKVIEYRITGLFTCAHPEDITYSQIARAAFRAFNTKGTVRFLGDKPDIPDNIPDKDDTLYQLIGFRPQISIETGMQRIAASKTKAT